MDDPDNDGISTEDEISFGMDPYDPNDISIGVGEYNLGLTYRDARVSIRGNVEAIRITGTTLETNYALGSKVSTSSVESKGLGGAYVSDGSIGDGVTEGSRWSSAFADDQFIQLALPKAAVLNQVVIHWEAAYAERYQALISSDGQVWEPIYDGADPLSDGIRVPGPAGNLIGAVDTISFSSPTEVAFIRLKLFERRRFGLNKYGFSIYEIEAYNTAPRPWSPFNESHEFRLQQGWGDQTVTLELSNPEGGILSINKTFHIPISHYLVDENLKYFFINDHTVHPSTQFAFEGYSKGTILNNRVPDSALDGYTQPTAMGFYAQLLGDIASGVLRCDYINQEQAIEKINRLADALLQYQASLGFEGLLPWIQVNASNIWERAGSDYGTQVALIDNANLTTSLAVLYGALLSDPLNQHPDIYGVSGILTKLDTFFDRQRQGYALLYDANTGCFYDSMKPNLSNTGYIYSFGHRWFYGSEERSTILLLALLFPEDIPESAYYSSVYQIKDDTLVHHTGAFQMLWPTLTMPETLSPKLERHYQDYVDRSLEFSYTETIPGFLSASFINETGTYDPGQGINAISFDESTREDVASIYTVGAAYPFRPTAVNEFLEWIWDFYTAAGHEMLNEASGLWEGFNTTSNKTIKIQVSANISTFILGIINQGPEHMLRFLHNQMGMSQDLVKQAIQRHPLAHRTAYASSEDYTYFNPPPWEPDASHFACYAVDGNLLTRWSSRPDPNDSIADNQHLSIYYETPLHFDELLLFWQTVAIYTIEVSNDGDTWTPIFEFPADTNLSTEHFLNADDNLVIQHKLHFPTVITARYIRIQCMDRATQWGYSLWEIVPQLSIQSWRAQYFSAADLDNPSHELDLWGNTADPDADNVVNLLEYSFGTDPLQAEHDILPRLTIVTDLEDDYLAIEYQQTIRFDPVNIRAEVSADLNSPWNYNGDGSGTIWTAPAGLAKPNGDGSTETIIIRSLEPIQAARKQFIRLHVAQP